ncbi:MAG: hypothetical protein M1355_04450 [Patescibacteria group bacterium]|nr:hypothetical protein [Patescibacteria group bacterium]
MKKKLAGIFAGLTILLTAALIIGWKFIPINKIPFISQGNNFAAKALCKYPVKVGSDSMEPFLKNGTTVDFDRCFESTELTNGKIIVYKESIVQRIAIIRGTQNAGRFVYRVSNEKNPQGLDNVLPSDIVAVLDLDTSASKYVANEQDLAVDQNIEHYMSEAYLAAIPKGSGIELATLAKTTEFDLKNNKFCFVVNPIKDLTDVDFVVTPENSDKEVYVISDVLYKPGENKNCYDDVKIGSGNYVFKIFVKNMLIKSIPFRVL